MIFSRPHHFKIVSPTTIFATQIIYYWNTYLCLVCMSLCWFTEHAGDAAWKHEHINIRRYIYICIYSWTSVVERLSPRTNRFPNTKPKQKTHRFPTWILVPKQANWQPGTRDVWRQSVSYVAASSQCSLLLEFAVPFLDFLCVCCFL
jgi:hypothetical protein